MKTSRFSDAQIMAILKQAEDGIPVAQLCREHGMSDASFYKWRARLGGMWHGCVHGFADEEHGGREPAAEEDVCRAEHAKRSFLKEALGKKR
jgi:putative transposase